MYEIKDKIREFISKLEQWFWNRRKLLSMTKFYREIENKICSTEDLSTRKQKRLSFVRNYQKNCDHVSQFFIKVFNFVEFQLY